MVSAVTGTTLLLKHADMDVQAQIQAATAAAEVIGTEIETVESVYYTDESPEYRNTPGNRFVHDYRKYTTRKENGSPMVSPRYFRELVTTIVNRTEITEAEWLASELK